MKQFDAKSVSISGSTFYIRPFPAFVSANLSGELAAVAAPLLAAAAPLAGSGKGIMDIEVGADAGAAISGAFSSLSGDSIEGLLKKLLVQHGNIAVEAGGGAAEPLTEDLANELFCGEAQDMFMLAFEVVKINFGRFFARLTPLFGKAAGGMAEAGGTSGTGGSTTASSPIWS